MGHKHPEMYKSPDNLNERKVESVFMNDKKNRMDAAEEGTGLYEALVRYSDSDYYPYHMPGHKRNREAGAMAGYYGIDITEIDGFDNLHHADSILKEAQKRANRLYGNEDTETYYLVNGSTCGVLASVMAVTGKGDEILISRNCHKSVYHAAILQELQLRYYYPPILGMYGICDGVDAEEIDRLLMQYPDCRAVVITSPTYEGIISDVRAVADAVHAQDKVLIVDEAHGAHLGLYENPPGAIAGGADLVIHSLHKTLPAMTQTALLHVQGERVNRGKLAGYLSLLQTSSPSYVLMASMDSCIRYLETEGAERYAYMQGQYDNFCRKTEKCRYIRIGDIKSVHKPCSSSACVGKEMRTSTAKAKETEEMAEGVWRTVFEDTVGKKHHMTGWDIGKLVIHVQDNLLGGQQLYDLLRDDYHLQMEMAAGNYVLAMMTIMDTEEGWQRLADALCRIDDRIEAGEFAESRESIAEWKDSLADINNGGAAEMSGSMTAAKAWLGKREEVLLAESAGRVAADFINLYPPGIPLVVPGEVVRKETAAQIGESIRMGLQVQGVNCEEKIAVVCGL